MKHIHFTPHARMRYQRRIGGTLTVEDVAVLGSVRSWAPAFVQAHNADAYLIHEDAVFPLLDDGNRFIALTCLRRRRRSKEDCRAMRQWARDERDEAAA